MPERQCHRLIKYYPPSHPEDKTRPDYLATVDTDPASPTYSQVRMIIINLDSQLKISAKKQVN